MLCIFLEILFLQFCRDPHHIKGIVHKNIFQQMHNTHAVAVNVRLREDYRIGILLVGFQHGNSDKWIRIKLETSSPVCFHNAFEFLIKLFLRNIRDIPEIHLCPSVFANHTVRMRYISINERRPQILPGPGHSVNLRS